MSAYTPGTYAVPYIQLPGCDRCAGWRDCNTGAYHHLRGCPLRVEKTQ